MAALLMAASWLIMLRMIDGWWIPALTATIFVAVSGYLFSRPTPVEAAAPVVGPSPGTDQPDANSPAR